MKEKKVSKTIPQNDELTFCDFIKCDIIANESAFLT
jgi:hypothetical protein